VAAESSPWDLAKKILMMVAIQKMKFLMVMKQGFFWKKLPSRIFIAEEEKTMPGFKPAKDRLTLPFGASAYGTLMLKPMLIYHSENPRALKKYVKTRLFSALKV
jgi:hypothetical protein